MLDKNERQYFSQEHAASVIQTVIGTLHSAGIALTQTGPNQWTGRGQAASYGVVPKVLVSMMPMQNGFFLDVRIVADLESNAIVILIVLWFVFFPVALILGLMGYQDWERRQVQLFQAVWMPLANRIATPPGPQFGPPMAGTEAGKMNVFQSGLLDGRVALVTGGGSGIGAGIARRFAQQGAKVALLGRKLEKLESVEQQIREAGGQALGIACDVRDYAALEAGVARVMGEWGRLDVLVNSAAGNFLAPAAGLSANGFKSVVEIDLVGTFNASRACFSALAVQGGSIVSITATQAWVPTPLQCHAGAAKAGIAKLTQDLALKWGSSKIRVNAVAPGPIADTEGMRKLAPGESEMERFQAAMPLGRWGTIDEVADAVLFLVSPAAAFITGTTLVVDGGQALMGAGNLFSMG